MDVNQKNSKYAADTAPENVGDFAPPSPSDDTSAGTCMTLTRFSRRLLLVAGLVFATTALSLMLTPTHSAAQTDCPIADTISYPIDTTMFQMVQDYGVASPRHQGRFHTGEDWAYLPGQTEGQPVRAAANGRVTYSYPLGWGRDGGVIILEHTFADGSVYYSQYGHIAESDTVTFPPRLTCVNAGDIIAVVGDARPAPHVHFEIRAAMPDVPGPGYSREAPLTSGWLRPMQFVTNQQARLQPAFAWSVMGNTFGPVAPPLALNDGGLMVIDGDRLRGITYDGRVLWRVIQEKQAVALLGYQANPYAIFADGDVHLLDFEGNLQERWNLPFDPDGPPIMVEGAPVFHTRDNGLVALAPDLRDIAWRLDGVPAYSRAHAGADLIGLVTLNETLLLVSVDGDRVGEAELESGASLTTAPDGTLLAYTAGGLWTIDAGGTWSLLLPDAPPGGGSAAVLTGTGGQIYLMDSERFYAYGPAGDLAWEARLPQIISGQTELAQYGGALVITSTHGHIVVLGASGGICGFLQIYGNDRAGVWSNLNDDGILRVAVGDQIVGLNWARFAASCAD